MATTDTQRHAHAAGRRADVYGVVLGYESADPWNRAGSTAMTAGHSYAPAKPHAGPARRLLINIAGH